MLNRRGLFAAAAGTGAAMLAAPARAAGPAGITTASIRGSLDATELGVRPGALDDQSKAFQPCWRRRRRAPFRSSCRRAAMSCRTSSCPRNVRLSGVAGATRIVYGGNGYLFSGQDTELVVAVGHRHRRRQSMDQGRRAGTRRPQRRPRASTLDNCRIVGSGKSAIALERVGGRISRSTITGAADVGIYSVEAGRLEISGNTVTDCGNGGILVHRWQPGDDGTMVTGNRVERIAAHDGGTGQHGNGINVFRADNVTVANNWIADCAFTAVRSNSGNNVQITGNHCLRSGETAIYSEFSFQGAVISSNIVDGAANGISIVNFNEGGRMAVCQGNIVRNLTSDGPYRSDPPGFGVGHRGRGRHDRHRQCRRARTGLRHPDRLGAVHAQRGGHRQRHPRSCGRHRCLGGRGFGQRRHLRQHHRRRQAGAPSSVIAGPIRSPAISRSGGAEDLSRPHGRAKQGQLTFETELLILSRAPRQAADSPTSMPFQLRKHRPRQLVELAGKGGVRA